MLGYTQQARGYRIVAEWEGRHTPNKNGTTRHGDWQKSPTTSKHHVQQVGIQLYLNHLTYDFLISCGWRSIYIAQIFFICFFLLKNLSGFPSSKALPRHTELLFQLRLQALEAFQVALQIHELILLVAHAPRMMIQWSERFVSHGFFPIENSLW